MKRFLVTIARKPSFTGDSIQGHRHYLQKLRQSNILHDAGGFADQTGGAYVIQTDALEKANKIVQMDPMYIEKTSVTIR
ncbi:hypothetical protein QS257_02005 [Terrilactibacillus sp. S3-3]|nr:hypothetical protein QS257_02005 [Terrilactibacillus sp. S3-3]